MVLFALKEACEPDEDIALGKFEFTLESLSDACRALSSCRCHSFSI